MIRRDPMRKIYRLEFRYLERVRNIVVVVVVVVVG